MKKTLSILSSIFLAANLFMATPLAAEETTTNTGTITVSNPTDGATYYAYKIFDVEYEVLNEENWHYSYTIKDSDLWYECIEDYIDSEDSCMKKVAKGDGTGIYYIFAEEEFGAAKFAKYLKAYLENNKEKFNETRVELEGTPPKATGLPLGYYFILGEYSDEEGLKFEALANLTTTDPAVTIYQKNSVDFDKEVNDTSVELGQTVTYTISGRIPNTEEYSEYFYSIQDTLSSGLTLNEDTIEILLEDEDEDEDKTSFSALPEDKYDLTIETSGFKVNLNVMELQEYKGRKIQVTYEATVNEAAISTISDNDAKLIYSNDPSDSTSTGTVSDKEKVYTSTLELHKHRLGLDGEIDPNKTLAGAVFVLSKDVGGEKKYYHSDGKVTWVDSLEAATPKTTDENGKASFEGLEDGTYYLVETKAPDGYNKLDLPVEIEIDGKLAMEGHTERLICKKAIGNGAGIVLPSTGAEGLNPYTFGGTMIVSIGIVIVIIRRYQKYNRQ